MNEHNGLVPRDHWIEDWERQRVIDYFDCHPLDGYRRLTFMMLDEDVVALSPSTTYRVLSKAGRLDRWNGKPSKKGTGFVQPLRPHQHWHTDISYLNLGGTFYYLCSFLVPQAVHKPQCSECSLFEDCLPEITSAPRTLALAYREVFDTTK